MPDLPEIGFEGKSDLYRVMTCATNRVAKHKMAEHPCSLLGKSSQTLASLRNDRAPVLRNKHIRIKDDYGFAFGE